MNRMRSRYRLDSNKAPLASHLPVAKKVFAVLLCITISSCVPSPFGATRSPEVRGRVIDAKSRQALPMATVQWAGTSYPSTKSKGDGSFLLRQTRTGGFWFTGPCPKGPRYDFYHTLLVSLDGYSTTERHTVEMTPRSTESSQLDAGQIPLFRASDEPPGRRISQQINY